MKLNTYPNRSDLRTLLLVDDEHSNLHALKQILQLDYHLLFAKDGQKALEISQEQQPDLILLDVLLPDFSGFEICRQLKQDSRTARIPVIFVTSMTDRIDETHGFDVGAVDYISKPLNSAIVKVRVATHLSLVNIQELQDTQQQIIRSLGRAAEYRDNETGLHVVRISHYSRLLALAAGFSERAADEIFQAAPMHDIGKIGIPDRILLKPGTLNEEEWKIMRQHPQIGADIIGEHDSSMLKTARMISLTHHEKWDGSGYPNQLQGENIPLVGRIVTIVDVFDALNTKRPYKEAWPIENAFSYLQQESGRHFDAELVHLFSQVLPEIKEIIHCWSEESVTKEAICYG